MSRLRELADHLARFRQDHIPVPRDDKLQRFRFERETLQALEAIMRELERR